MIKGCKKVATLVAVQLTVVKHGDEVQKARQDAITNALLGVE
jgi:hypothetical protein